MFLQVTNIVDRFCRIKIHLEKVYNLSSSIFKRILIIELKSKVKNVISQWASWTLCLTYI